MKTFLVKTISEDCSAEVKAKVAAFDKNLAINVDKIFSDVFRVRTALNCKQMQLLFSEAYQLED